MTPLLIFWLSVSIGFLIIEMITVTFYGFAIAIAGFITSIYVYFYGGETVTITQGVVFAVASLITCFFLPRYLSSRIDERVQGLDMYIGEKRKVKKVGEDFKVILDGVEYMIDIDGVKSGDKVELTERKGSVFHGKIIG